MEYKCLVNPFIVYALYHIFILATLCKRFTADAQLNFRCILVFLACLRQQFLTNVSFVRCSPVIASVIVNKLLVHAAFLFDSCISSSNLPPDTCGPSLDNFVSSDFFSVLRAD